MSERISAESNNDDANEMALAQQDDDSIMQLDPESLDPGQKYRFVFNHQNRISRMQMKGYTFVTEDDGVRLKYEIVGALDSSGHILVGDSVLMRCPKNRYDRRRRDVRERTEARMNESGSAQAKNDIEDMAQRTHIPTPIITRPGGTVV
jgi:hypothetical protein